MNALRASMELGGTKTIVAVARDPIHVLAQARFPTTGPAETFAEIERHLVDMAAEHGPIARIGVASFGPVDLRTGTILPTPKPNWEGADLSAPLRRFHCPITIDTDVNAAALAEARFGAGQGALNLVYITVGTGLGGGLLLDGRLRHGLLHPEIGHLRLRRHPDDDFAGCCPFHGDCLEGLVCGPAITARLGRPLDQCAPDHPFRAVLAHYLGQLCTTLLLVVSVDRIVIGGGVLARLDLHGDIRRNVVSQLNGYLPAAHLDRLTIVPPRLADAGLIGGFILGEQEQTEGGGVTQAA